MTISGLLDLSYHTVSGNGTTATTKLNSVGASVGSATSAINFNVLEDLGGGMKAQAFYAFDPRAIINNNTAAIGRHEAYVGLSGAFGGIKLGSPNTAALNTYGAGSPLGTATGSAYANIETASGGAVRYNNSVRYDTPAFNGFGASLTYVPGNKDALTGGAVPQVTDLGLSYANGPLNVNASSMKRSATGAQDAVAANTSADTTANTLGSDAVAAAAASTYNSIGANYAIGAAKVFAGYAKKTTDGSTADITVTRLGANYTMGAVTLIGQYARAETTGTAAIKKATGLRAEYALSKRTATYVAYEAYDTGAASASKTNTAAVGVRHTF